MESSNLQQTSSLIPNLDGMELQNMLTDLQKKCETYKSNYNVLKHEHSSLQDDLMHAQGEVKRLLAQQDKLQSQLSERSGELLDKKRENEELRLQVMTPQRLELLKVQVQQEMEAPIKERFHKLEEEAEKYRSDFNKLRYAFTVLIAQLEHQKEEDVGALEGQRMRYEIAHLKKEKDNLVAQYQNSDQLHDRKHLEILLKEKTQLTMMVKGLQAEVAELQALKDNSDQQVENIQLTQNRQLTESQAMVKSLEAERQSLRLRVERTEGELNLSQEQNSQLTGQLHKAKREVSSLTCQIESLKLSHKTDVDNVKLEFTRSKGEVERERDTLKGQMESLKTEVEVLKEVLEKHNEVLVEKEREMVRKVKSVCEEELHKTTILHEEKLELEQHLAKLEQQRMLQDTTVQAQKREWEEQLRFSQKSEESMRKELQGMKTRLKKQSSQLEELERQQAEVEDLKQKNQQLCVHVGTLSKSEAELIDTNQHLREKLAVVKEDSVRRGAERLVEDSKAREAKLEEKYSQLKDKIQRMAAAEKKRKAQVEKKEKSLQNTIQVLKAQIDELNREGAAANKRLQDYQQRHSEFRSLLMSNSGSFGAGTAQITPTCRPALFLGPEILLSNTQEDEREQQQLALLRQRVDDLERVQQKQLEELGCVEQRDQHNNYLC
ncbi:centrosomal protein of 83 kDa-like isoform X2 [Dunckerocampus dactyliophorus]|uniref:centrosomal protein of 83 kDa-like isoform X2 n=1 Tax=Dunckerocampus dactyliophorus TaxID=161453 RepID=UPI0024049EB6|nr:centrosomal protein of 83 kDa-like isoform X2 [Dunckerocampus dactyliophorus]